MHLLTWQNTQYRYSEQLLRAGRLRKTNLFCKKKKSHSILIHFSEMEQWTFSGFPLLLRISAFQHIRCFTDAYMWSGWFSCSLTRFIYLPTPMLSGITVVTSWVRVAMCGPTADRVVLHQRDSVVPQRHRMHSHNQSVMIILATLDKWKAF